MLSFLRRNAIALLALFIALGGTSIAAVGTITSNDIVDGQVKNPDLAAGAVTASKLAANAIGGSKIADGSIAAADLHADSVSSGTVKNDSLTGSDVKESTLGRVPDAARLGGVDAAAFRPGTAMATQQTDKCAVTGIYKLCAPVTLTVPSGAFFKVDVHTSMTAFGATAGQGLFCAAAEGPACLNGTPSGFTLNPSQYMNVSHSGTAYFGPGTHTFGMAARFDVAPAANINTANTTTTIRWHNSLAESAQSAAAARAAKVGRKPAHAMTPKPLK